MPTPRMLLLGTCLALVAGVLTGTSGATRATGDVQITTVSNRADLVSAGDVLIRVTTPGSRPDLARVELNGRDVTTAFGLRSNGKGLGLLGGLRLGRNVVTATLPDGRGARLVVTNHPQGGPVFSGPQIQPWSCSNGVKNKKCRERPTYEFSYVPNGTTGTTIGATGVASAGTLRPYDPESPPPPGTVATTTTTDGVTVPFIVRTETGYIDRDQYSISTLWQPGKPWESWAPQRQFNHRLVITHGASCDTSYESGSAPSTTDTGLLAGGFVVMSHALDNAGHNCNIITQAESLVMTKEYVVDHYGTVRWTIGSGCSGGSLVQQQVANAYPGLYQGISPQCSFTDAWSSAMQYVDYTMLLRYFQDPSRWDAGTVWDPEAISQVLDHPNVGNPVTFTRVIANSGDPSRSCPGVPDDKVYDPESNPKGVKCTLQDYMVNVFGKRPDGFANRPFGNAGIQYGLDGLRRGLLSPAQFVDLNTHIGGLDIRGDVRKRRNVPDLVGLRRVYRSGAVDSANNLDQVAIIDLRGPDPGAFHDVYRTYAMRARLLRNFGTAANQVLWRGQAPIIGDSTYAVDAVYALDRWLARVDADDRPIALARKIIQDKPGDIAERCTDGRGTELPSEVCDQTVASYGTPRMAADGPLADDTLHCRMKPLRKADYDVQFTESQWSRLKRVFADGVCDYSRPGVAQRGAVAWLTYQDARGRVVYGGTPMGSAPTASPLTS
jgi:hypothetical protein